LNHPQPDVRGRTWLRLLGAAALALTLSACGGGGGGDEGVVVAAIAPSAPSAQQCSPNNLYAAPGLRSGSLAVEKRWVRSYVNEAYLWYDEVPNVNANQPAYSSNADVYGSLDSYFEALTATPRDPKSFSFTYPTLEWNALSQSGVTAGYGIEFVFGSFTAPDRNIRIAYVEPGSEAAAKGLQRGDRVYTLDGYFADTENSDAGIAALNAATLPQAADLNVTHSWQFTRNNVLLAPLTMTVANITKKPVLDFRTFNYNNGEKVGYLLFNDHLATAEQQLIDAFTFFQNQAINDLVIDLRYNGGGALYIASELAYMVAGPARTANKVFEQLAFNAKRSAETNSPDSRLSFLDTRLTDGALLPSLNLPRVYVLATDNTCSASESIINSLRGVNVDVRLVGGTTCGKPYGFSAQDNCGISYFPIEFKGVNAKGFGDYADGFVPGGAGPGGVPGCSAADDLSRPLGDQNETMLANALEYRLCLPDPGRSARAAGGAADAGRCPQLDVARPGARKPHPAAAPMSRAAPGHTARRHSVAVAVAVAAIAGWLLAACAQPLAPPPPPPPAPELPARLAAAPGQACLDELSAFAAEQTGQNVQLAAGAFATGATLWLESGTQRGAGGRPLDGRSLRLPEVFQLTQRGGRCEISHERSSARRALGSCRCSPLPAR
jgi:carboxyl-terminal processing protease